MPAGLASQVPWAKGRFKDCQRIADETLRVEPRTAGLASQAVPWAKGRTVGAPIPGGQGRPQPPPSAALRRRLALQRHAACVFRGRRGTRLVAGRDWDGTLLTRLWSDACDPGRSWHGGRQLRKRLRAAAPVSAELVHGRDWHAITGKATPCVASPPLQER